MPSHAMNYVNADETVNQTGMTAQNNESFANIRSHNDGYYYEAEEFILGLEDAYFCTRYEGDYYFWNLPWPQEMRPRIQTLLEQRYQSRRRAKLVSIVIFSFIGGLFLLSLCIPDSQQQNSQQGIQFPPFLFHLLFVLSILVPLIPLCFWMDHRSIHEELKHEVQRTFPPGTLPPRPTPIFSPYF